MRRCVWRVVLAGALLVVGLIGYGGAAPASAAVGADDRIEYEAKLRVPLDDYDPLWSWLLMRYADLSWLDDGGYRFEAAFGDEDFTDTYFDTPDLQLLAADNGVRHRRRVVHSGPADDKDGRELLQIKLDRPGTAGVARSEIKFEVADAPYEAVLDADHPLLRLVSRRDRGAFNAAFGDLGIDPRTMRPILTLQQNRRRIYLSDQRDAFATLTLDWCTSGSWETDLRWAEIELELNEIRYTEADAVERQRMAAVIGEIEADLQAAFPAVTRDQTPKYNKAFAMIEATTWLPVHFLIRHGPRAGDVVLDVVIVAATALLLVAAVARWAWRRLRYGRRGGRHGLLVRGSGMMNR
jgi:hypothetical protein